MSVSGILSSNLFSYQNQSVNNNNQQFKQDFAQLGQDLQSGNLTAAQSDLSTLEQLKPQATTSTSTQSSPLAQAFSQLSQDLQSGNVSAAQQDYSYIQQDIQNHVAQTHHHHHGGGGESSAISQLFQQLGQDLQSGDLSSAQKAYATLQQDLQQLGQQGAQPPVVAVEFRDLSEGLVGATSCDCWQFPQAS
jgi:outer membrane protein assembly factor BamD (BamD/ComL family)